MRPRGRYPPVASFSGPVQVIELPITRDPEIRHLPTNPFSECMERTSKIMKHHEEKQLVHEMDLRFRLHSTWCIYPCLRK